MIILNTIQTQYQSTGKKTNRLGIETELAWAKKALYDYLILSVIDQKSF